MEFYNFFYELNNNFLAFFNSIELNTSQKLIFLFLLVYLVLVSVLDIKTRETPYFLSFPLLVSGIIANLVFFLITGNYFVILNALLAFLISFLKYRIKFWGGGDFLVFIGVSLFLNLIWPYFGNFLVFLISLYAATLFYNLGYLLFFYFKNKEFNFWELVILIPMFIIFFFLDFESAFTIFSLLFVVWILIVIHKLNLSFFIQKVSVNNLREEDWLAFEVLKDNKVIMKPEDVPFGLTKKEIEKLKKEVKFVYIKDGIPYLPAFLLALILTYLIYSVDFQQVLNFFIFR